MIKKAQINEITKFSTDKSVKIVDEGFEGELIIYTQIGRGDSILEYSVSPTGTKSLIATYTATLDQQKFFDGEPTLDSYLLRNS
jgi:hypothetical protein